MAEAKNSADKVDAPAATEGDRVAMLSLKKDGTPADYNPKFIDGDFGREATKRQFAENAVSKVDEQKRAEAEAAGVVGGPARSDKQDPYIEGLQKAHQAAEKAAESKAESVVKALTD